MNDKITTRVGRIISGTVNKLVDAAEDMAPEAVLEQAIREVDQAIDEVRAELGKTLAGKHLANTRLAEETRKHEELSEKIRLALEEGREDLAESAVSRLLDIEAQIPVLERTITQAKEQEFDLEGFVTALQARKREMGDELANYRAAVKQSSPGTAQGAEAKGRTVEQAVQGAESAFDRVMERASGVPGASTVPDRKTAKDLAELDDLARANRIKERLGTFKAKQKNE
jgi:phage shock protein A